MEKCHKLSLLIGLIATLATLIATVTTFAIFNEKKKKQDEAELEHYLDCSIQ